MKRATTVAGLDWISIPPSEERRLELILQENFKPRKLILRGLDSELGLAELRYLLVVSVTVGNIEQLRGDNISATAFYDRSRDESEAKAIECVPTALLGWQQLVETHPVFTSRGSREIVQLSPDECEVIRACARLTMGCLDALSQPERASPLLDFHMIPAGITFVVRLKNSSYSGIKVGGELHGEVTPWR